MTLAFTVYPLPFTLHPYPLPLPTFTFTLTLTLTSEHSLVLFALTLFLYVCVYLWCQKLAEDCVSPPPPVVAHKVPLLDIQYCIRPSKNEEMELHRSVATLPETCQADHAEDSADILVEVYSDDEGDPRNHVKGLMINKAPCAKVRIHESLQLFLSWESLCNAIVWDSICKSRFPSMTQMAHWLSTSPLQIRRCSLGALARLYVVAATTEMMKEKPQCRTTASETTEAAMDTFVEFLFLVVVFPSHHPHSNPIFIVAFTVSPHGIINNTNTEFRRFKSG